MYSMCDLIDLFVAQKQKGGIATVIVLLAAHFSDVYEEYGNLDGALFDQVNMNPWQVNAMD